MAPPRFVVLVWMHDHWGVMFTTDDENEATKVMGAASLKVPAVGVFDAQDPSNSYSMSRQ